MGGKELLTTAVPLFIHQGSSCQFQPFCFVILYGLPEHLLFWEMEQLVYLACFGLSLSQGQPCFSPTHAIDLHLQELLIVSYCFSIFILFFFFPFYFTVLGIKLRAFCMVGKYSTTELYVTPVILIRGLTKLPRLVLKSQSFFLIPLDVEITDVYNCT